MIAFYCNIGADREIPPSSRIVFIYLIYFQTKISLLQDAVNSGRLDELKSLLEEDPDKKKKLALCKDDAGVGLLHKAVYYDLKPIYKYLIEKYSNTVSMKDSVSRKIKHLST